MRRPHLTAKVVRGLRTITAAISSCPDEVLMGVEEEIMDGDTRRDFHEALHAYEWIERLCAWHNRKDDVNND